MFLKINEELDLLKLITVWIEDNHPTWTDFFGVLNKMNLNNLAFEIEYYLKGALVEEFDNAECGAGEEVRTKGKPSDVNTLRA